MSKRRKKGVDDSKVNTQTSPLARSRAYSHVNDYQHFLIGLIPDSSILNSVDKSYGDPLTALISAVKVFCLATDSFFTISSSYPDISN
jgi:hypothetical protein